MIEIIALVCHSWRSRKFIFWTEINTMVLFLRMADIFFFNSNKRILVIWLEYGKQLAQSYTWLKSIINASM